MISAVVLIPGSWRGDDPAREREIVARSMIWLVSAAVAGTVRDVTLAVPPGLELAELADQAGCVLVQAENEAERLRSAVAGCRGPRVLVLEAGYQPDPGLIEEIDIFGRREPEDSVGLLLAAPTTFLQRLFPDRAPAVGILGPRAKQVAKGFGPLARRMRREGTPLLARARRLR